MSHILTVVGARPQFVKAAAMHRVLKKSNHQITYIHTGQHYDDAMSGLFFDQLDLPEPDQNLGIGGTSSNQQVGHMMIKINEHLFAMKPDLVIVYGDTNSTLAASLAAKSLDIPVAHIEAGLRSFNKRMPEETNRIVCDHCSTLLFAANKMALENLEKERFSLNVDIQQADIDTPYVAFVGDVMLDNAIHYSSRADIKDELPHKYALLTMHRPSNVDDEEALEKITHAFLGIAESTIPIVWPVHPRTEKRLKAHGNELWVKLEQASNILLLSPQGYLEMLALEKGASLIMTDSGGVQKEAFYQKVPVVVLREQTEWAELVEAGNAILVGNDPVLIKTSVNHFLENPPLEYPEFYGSGKSSQTIADAIYQFLSR